VSEPRVVDMQSVLAVVFGVLMCWIIYHNFAAQRQARDFCATVSVGDPITGILERAVAAGADRRHTRWTKSPQLDVLSATFVGAHLFDSHVCLIRARGGVVTERLVTQID
jgi:hypothetical protein